MFTLLKLGGSILTDRTRLFSFDSAVATRVAREIRQSGQVPIVVHGTGRAGKAYGRHYTLTGRATPDWRVFQLTTEAIRQLGDRLGAVLRDEGLPHCLIPANALFCRRDGGLHWQGPDPLLHLLDCGVIPVLCGDVLVEGAGRFAVVSSDEIMSFLAAALPVQSCIFATDVDGVLDPRGRLVAEVQSAGEAGRHASDSEDVTGGMAEKLAGASSAARDGAAVTIINGRVPGRVRDALCGRPVVGSRVLAPHRLVR